MNPYGHYSDDGREFIITRPETPAPWVNYIFNDRYAGLVSHTGGGFSFLRCPRDNRLTRFRYNSLPWDRPGRYVYLRDKARGEYWSLTWQPTAHALDFYRCHHGLGYSTIVTESHGIRSAVTYFVPRDADLELWFVQLENRSEQRRELDIFSYVELCLGSALNDLINQPNDKHFPRVYYSRKARALFATRNYWMVNRGVSVMQPNRDWPYVVFFTSSLPVVGFDGSKDAFIGRWRSEANPEAVERGECFNTEITAGDPCAALQMRMTLLPHGTTEFVVALGIVEKENHEATAKRLIEKYTRLPDVEHGLRQLKTYWQDYLKTVVVETPDANLNLLLNVWNRYQTAVTFRMARNAGYYHGGLLFGFGIRDQCQDLLGPLLSEPHRVRERIVEIASYQFADGSMLHNFFPMTQQGEKTGHSDTPLWLPFAITAYLKETGDFAFLHERVPYYDGSEGTMEEHLTRAIDWGLATRTERGLPKFGPGDWNDTLDWVGRGGKGESVWVAEFLAFVLQEAVALFSHLKNEALAKRYQRAYGEIADAVNRLCWDGRWYVRGFRDDGRPIGSQAEPEGKIFINTQSWAVISGIAPRERALSAMDAVQELLDTPKGPKILAPAYTKVDPTIGLATRCVPGKKENGAIFNHAASWAILAECLLGRGDRAWDLYRRMMPMITGADADVYKMEPYVYAEYVTSPDHPTYGEASHSWLTGSAVWMLRIGLDYLLGVRPSYDGLIIDPCLPSSWKKYRVSRTFRGVRYEIRVENPRGRNRGVARMSLNGRAVEGSCLPAEGGLAPGEMGTVEVILG